MNHPQAPSEGTNLSSRHLLHQETCLKLPVIQLLENVLRSGCVIHSLTHLLDAQSLLMHVAQIKHGLGTVLLLRCQSIVNKCGFIINIGTKPIKMVISKFNSCNCISYKQQKIARQRSPPGKESLLVSYEDTIGSCYSFLQFAKKFIPPSQIFTFF